jgi:hypothetical protein
MIRRIWFYLFLLVGLFVLTADAALLSRFGIENFGRILIFLFFLFMGVVVNFPIFWKAVWAARNPKQSIFELLKKVEDDVNKKR